MCIHISIINNSRIKLYNSIFFNISKGSQCFSGSEYKKWAKDKEYKECKILNKIHKLSTFFEPATSSSLNASDNGQQHDLKKIETTMCESNFVSNNLTTSTLNMDSDKFDIYNDSAKRIIIDVTRNYMAKHGINQNLNNDFTCSKREYPDKNRFLNKSLFVRTRINGEIQSRPWLVFSNSTGVQSFVHHIDFLEVQIHQH